MPFYRERKGFNLQDIIIIFFFFSIVFSLTTPVSSNDFWWHLATGRWIWQNKKIPSDDPFGIPLNLDEAPFRKNFILRQYWLSQVIFYLLYRVGGIKILILLRAFCLGLAFLLTYSLSTKRGAHPYSTALLIFLSYMVVVREFQYIGIKPQMWTTLFSILIIYLIETMQEGRRHAPYALPGLMLLWSNMHGGFILGDIIIIIYIISFALKRRASRSFLVPAILAIVLSGINPNGFTAFISTILSLIKIERLSYLTSIVETQSLFRHASIEGILTSLPFLSSLVILSLLSYFVNLKKLKTMDIQFILLHILFLLMATKAIRYIIFLAFFSVVITALNLREMPSFVSSIFIKKPHIIRGAKIITGLVCVGLSMGLFKEGARYTGLKMATPYNTSYNGAVWFIKDNSLKGNAFNDYNAGGFLIWNLYPDMRFFIDGRALSLKGFNIYRALIHNPETRITHHKAKPIYKQFFDYYGIDFVILPGCDESSGTVLPLVLTLIKDRQWPLVYADSNVLIFQRDTQESRGFIKTHRLPDRYAYDNIITTAYASTKRLRRHNLPEWMFSLAIAYEGKGDKNVALYWLNEYLKARPSDHRAIKMHKRLVNSP